MDLGERLWARVRKGEGCWEWTGPTSRGYGSLAGGRVHRISWALHNGPIPPGLYVCHHCDNPSCVRPDHLFLGTAADNVADMMAKGRQRPRFGSRHPRTKLNEAAVRDIRRLVAEGISLRGAARVHGVDHATVSEIIRGGIWKHVA